MVYPMIFYLTIDFNQIMKQFNTETVTNKMYKF